MRRREHRSGSVPPGSAGGAFPTCRPADDPAPCTLDFSACQGTTTTTEPVVTTTTTTPEGSTTTTTTPEGSTTTTTTPEGSTTTTSEPPVETTTTTSTSSTTTTTQPPVCGNGIVEPGEQCDGDIVCGGSAEGVFLPEAEGGPANFVDCDPETCQIIETGPCPTSTTTSTTTTSSTTLAPVTTTTTTTSTTAPDCAALCGNSIIDVECGEVCDTENFGGESCSPDSAGGALLCTDECHQIDRSGCTAPAEDCTNCVDDNGNGLVDYEDPECCSGTQEFAATLRKARMRPKGSDQSFLRIRSALGSNIGVNPMANQVTVQIRQQNGPQVLCARVPVGAMMKMHHGKVFKFWYAKNQKVVTAEGIDDLKIRFKKNGQARFGTQGKRVQFTTPNAGSMQVIVGFHDPTVGNQGNVCSAFVQAFRTGKKGALLAP